MWRIVLTLSLVLWNVMSMESTGLTSESTWKHFSFYSDSDSISSNRHLPIHTQCASSAHIALIIDKLPMYSSYIEWLKFVEPRMRLLNAFQKFQKKLKP